MIYIITILLLFVAELLYFRIADHFNIIDKPNERSSHSSVTLRGGGILFWVGVLFYFLMSGWQYPWFFAGLTLVAAISFADDVKLMIDSWGKLLDTGCFLFLPSHGSANKRCLVEREFYKRKKQT